MFVFLSTFTSVSSIVDGKTLKFEPHKLYFLAKCDISRVYTQNICQQDGKKPQKLLFRFHSAIFFLPWKPLIFATKLSLGHRVEQTQPDYSF